MTLKEFNAIDKVLYDLIRKYDTQSHCYFRQDLTEMAIRAAKQADTVREVREEFWKISNKREKINA